MRVANSTTKSLTCNNGVDGDDDGGDGVDAGDGVDDGGGGVDAGDGDSAFIAGATSG